MAFRRPHSVLSIHIAAADALYDSEEQSLKLFFLSGTLFKKEVGRQPFLPQSHAKTLSKSLTLPKSL